MISVRKGPEPDGLKILREEVMAKGLSPRDAFCELRNPLKAQVLECLRRDQGQLCVYCMSKIPRTDKDEGIARQTIEHFIPLDPKDGRDVGQALDYQNLFAVCHGNVRMRKKGERRTITEEDLTCDKHRGNVEFRKINPCREETLQTIFYTMDGRIGATDPDVQFDLISTLNLNAVSSPVLKERKAALDELIEDMGRIEENELHKYCTDRLKAFLEEKETKTPYVGILIWYLRSMALALS